LNITAAVVDKKEMQTVLPSSTSKLNQKKQSCREALKDHPHPNKKESQIALDL
jgi:hypothetical protein